MSKEKQIEEMARYCCNACEFGGALALESNIFPCAIDNEHTTCHLALETAEILYNAGYRKQRAWISVDERLPEDVYGKNRKQITVLVCTKSGKVSTTSRQRAVKFDKTKLEFVELDSFEWSKNRRVTHWMPLPEAPIMKGADNEQRETD